MKSKNTFDGMLTNMAQILEEPTHQKIFKIAQSQAPDTVIEIKKSAFQEILDSFLDISAQLDILELPNSAIRTIQAAEIFSQEFYKLADTSTEKK